MIAYRLAFLEAIAALGLKKAVAELLLAGSVIDENTAGQIITHINNGGVTKIVKTVEVK